MLTLLWFWLLAGFPLMIAVYLIIGHYSGCAGESASGPRLDVAGLPRRWIGTARKRCPLHRLASPLQRHQLLTGALMPAASRSIAVSLARP